MMFVAAHQKAYPHWHAMHFPPIMAVWDSGGAGQNKATQQRACPCIFDKNLQPPQLLLLLALLLLLLLLLLLAVGTVVVAAAAVAADIDFVGAAQQQRDPHRANKRCCNARIFGAAGTEIDAVDSDADHAASPVEPDPLAVYAPRSSRHWRI